MYIIASYVSSVTIPVTDSTLSSASILSSNIPSKSNSHANFSNVSFIKIPIEKVSITKAAGMSDSNPYTHCSGVPFLFTNFKTDSSSDDMLVLRSPLVPGEYISSVRRRDWQALLWEVENKMITTAAIACSKVSHLLTEELKAKAHAEEKQVQIELRQQTLTDSLLTEETTLTRNNSKMLIDVTLPSTAPSSLFDLVVSKAGISTPLEGRRSRHGARSGDNKKPSVLSINEF